VEGKLVVFSKQGFVRVGYVSLSLFPCCPSWFGLVGAEKDSLWLRITDCVGTQSLPAEIVLIADVVWQREIVCVMLDNEMIGLISGVEGIGWSVLSDKDNGSGAGRALLRGGKGRGRCKIPTADILSISGRSCMIGIVGDISPLTPDISSWS
jgi:hypothetical protein